MNVPVCRRRLSATPDQINHGDNNTHNGDDCPPRESDRKICREDWRNVVHPLDPTSTGRGILYFRKLAAAEVFARMPFVIDAAHEQGAVEDCRTFREFVAITEIA